MTHRGAMSVLRVTLCVVLLALAPLWAVLLIGFFFPVILMVGGVFLIIVACFNDVRRIVRGLVSQEGKAGRG